MIKHLVAPSILACDYGNIQKEIEMINDTDADWLHVDIMDGMFVPNISFGADMLKVIKLHSKLPMDVHLMIEQPNRYIQTFRNAGADNITVHLEACTHLHKSIEIIKNAGAKAGVALNPHSPVSLLEDILENLDIVLLMSVNPGFGGQKFIYQTIDKIRKLREMILVKNLPTLIEIDGGIGLQNAESLLQAGADVLVAGSSVFKAGNPKLAVYALKNIGIKGLYA
ncbi:MAG: ribulose-phosphate 3-epimerase [Saprospiraceae bacterium]|jgi:ribulose-phosphate 3-epimerase|nr:ribulose-phosphate 3-epimerase [Saprospiraceae bacterium]